jgi:hypothetical protein
MQGTARVILEEPTAVRGSISPVRSGRELLAHFVVPAYIVSALFLLTPIFDVVTNVWPPAPGTVTWRYGAAGAAANYLISSVFGAFLGCCVAAWAEHRRTLRVFAVLSFLGVLLLVLVAGDFAMDVAQLRPLVPPTDMQAFLIGAVKAEVKYLTAIIAMLVLGLCSWRASRSSRRS